ncbi:hypothetical protein KA005_49275, partial [bacterium]|nr:hypothetical protein [bacterium]
WNIWVEVHSSIAGTSGTKEDSVSIIGEASDVVARDDVPEDYTWIEFEFSGVKPSLTKLETFVNAGSSQDQKVLKVDSTTGFIVGGSVVIGEGTDRKEVKIIGSIQAGVSLTMTGNLEYTHTPTQKDLVENSYYLVLYTTGTVPTREDWQYVNWARHSGYDDGLPWHIDESMTWPAVWVGDLCLKIFGYETAEAKLVEYGLSNLDDIKELREANGATLLAQEFLVYEDNDVTKVKVRLSKVGSLAGKFIWAEIHSGHGGTSETKNLSDDIVPQASDSVDADSLSVFPDYGFDKVTDTSIAFVATTKKITDTNNGLAGFLTGDKIKVIGSVENDGTYIVATGGVAGEIVVEEDLTDEDAGASITVEQIWVTFTFSGTKPAIEADKVYYIVIYGDFDISSSNYVKVAMDKVDPDYTVGKRWDIDEELGWTAKEDIDLLFELWTSISDVLGDYSYVITYERGGNYPCESN